MINFLVEIDVGVPLNYSDINGVTDTIMFLSCPLDNNNPSYNILRNKNVPVRLNVPSINRKLSDNINGIYLNQSFSISLINNDGYFDNDKKNDVGFLNYNYFGRAIRLYKTTIDNPTFNDFKLIARGKITNIKTSFYEFILDVADDLKSMDNDFIKPISELNISFPFATTPTQVFAGGGMIDGTLKSNAPYVYGTTLIDIKQIAHYALIPYTYWPSANTYAFDVYYLAEGIQEILAFYNKDGQKIDLAVDRPDMIGNWEGRMRGLVVFDNRLNMCTIPRIFQAPPHEYLPADESIIPTHALVKGKYSNIGDIIKDILYVKQGNIIGYNNEEYNLFTSKTYNIGISINSGTVKSVIENILKNDNAFLIQQPDGNITIRRYDLDYNKKIIDNKTITKINLKSYDNFINNYASEVLLRYNLPIDPQNTILPETRIGNVNILNSNSEKIYKRNNLRIFDTQLNNIDNTRSFGNNIIKRFSNAKLLLNIGVGNDISDYNLLDTVDLDLTNINGRNFSNVKKWKIKEINYVQDTLLL